MDPVTPNYCEPLPLHSIVQTYLNNRKLYYETLLPRVHHPVIRKLIAEAADVFQATPEIMQSLQTTQEITPELDLASALQLGDLLKKPNAGRELARLAISIEDALARTATVESTGLSLFQLLTEHYPTIAAYLESEAMLHKKALCKILTLSDDLRYHKVGLFD